MREDDSNKFDSKITRIILAVIIVCVLVVAIILTARRVRDAENTVNDFINNMNNQAEYIEEDVASPTPLIEEDQVEDEADNSVNEVLPTMVPEKDSYLTEEEELKFEPILVDYANDNAGQPFSFTSAAFMIVEVTDTYRKVDVQVVADREDGGPAYGDKYYWLYLYNDGTYEIVYQED